MVPPLETKLHVHDTDFHLLVAFLLLLHSFSSVKNELIPSHSLELPEKNVSNLNGEKKNPPKSKSSYTLPLD